jgi:hypothetical protein
MQYTIFHLKMQDSMSSSLPTLDISNFIIEREKTRSTWESDFENNHISFAENLANGIAKQVIENFGNRIKDPYKQSIFSKKKFVSNIPLEFVRSHTAKDIIRFTEGCEKLPPFNEWLTKFSIDQKKSEHHFEENLRGIDREYFEELMAIVGRLAEKKLNEIFSELTSNFENKDLQYKVIWYRQTDQQFSNPSDFRDNYLSIELWFNEKTIPQQIGEKGSKAIEQHRFRQKQLNHIRMRNNIIITVIIVILVLMSLKSGILKINLPTHNKEF